MTQDFGGNRRPSKSRKSGGARRGNRAPSSPWAWFTGGLLTGVFACAVGWLAVQQAEHLPQVARESVADARPQDGPRFDFYELLPRQRVEVDQEAISAAQRNNADDDQYLLQAGSFKLAEDADQRRAALILLGLDARVQDITGDNGRWYRVYIGPFQSRSRLAKARSLTAQEGIDTLVLRRPAPEEG